MAVASASEMVEVVSRTAVIQTEEGSLGDEGTHKLDLRTDYSLSYTDRVMARDSVLQQNESTHPSTLCVAHNVHGTEGETLRLVSGTAV